MAKKPQASGQQARFRDRIVDFIRVPASELKRNPKNWRTHPQNQEGAMRAILDQIGFVGALVARQTAAGLELIDGHLRAGIADNETVPVVVVDLDDAEAAKVLATFDPLTAMAGEDPMLLQNLLNEVGDGLDFSADLRQMIADLHDTLETEEVQGKLPEHQVPGMQLGQHEHYDYLVVLASTTNEWNVLCDRLGLKPVAMRHGRMGTARAIRANKLLPLLDKAQ